MNWLALCFSNAMELSTQLCLRPEALDITSYIVKLVEQCTVKMECNKFPKHM